MCKLLVLDIHSVAQASTLLSVYLQSGPKTGNNYRIMNENLYHKAEYNNNNNNDNNNWQQ